MTDAEYTDSLRQCTDMQKQIITYVDMNILNCEQEAVQVFITGGAGKGEIISTETYT